MIYIQLRPRIHSLPMLSGYQPVEKLILFVVFYSSRSLPCSININISYSLTLIAITDISVDGYIFIVPMADGCEYSTFLKLPPVSATPIDSNFHKMLINCHLATARCNRD